MSIVVWVGNQNNKRGHACTSPTHYKGRLMDYRIDTACNTIIFIIILPALISGFNIRCCKWLRNCFCGENVQENGNYSAFGYWGNWSKTLYNLTTADCLMPLWVYSLCAPLYFELKCAKIGLKSGQAIQLCFPYFDKAIGSAWALLIFAASWMYWWS